MKFEWKRDWLPLAAIMVSFAASLLLYSRLPDPMPTHWNASGEADGYSSRMVGAFLLPLVTSGMFLLLFVYPYFDPRRANLMRSSDAYKLIRTAAILFLSYMHLVALYSVIRGTTLSNTLVMGGVGVAFMVIGNYMPRIRPNWIAGIRTPWTLSSDRVWKETHRLGGRAFVLGGLILLVGSLVAPQNVIAVLIPTLVIVSVVPIVYSFILFRREQQATEA